VGTAGEPSASRDPSHSSPSANVPRTIQQGLTAAQIRSPASASLPDRHQSSTWVTLPDSVSNRWNTATRSDQGAGTRAMPTSMACSAVRTA